MFKKVQTFLKKFLTSKNSETFTLPPFPKETPMVLSVVEILKIIDFFHSSPYEKLQKLRKDDPERFKFWEMFTARIMPIILNRKFFVDLIRKKCNIQIEDIKEVFKIISLEIEIHGDGSFFLLIEEDKDGKKCKINAFDVLNNGVNVKQI